MPYIVSSPPIPYPRPKRLVDKLLAAVLLVVLSPVLVVVLVAIAIDMLLSRRDRGSFLYRERRISKGRPFDLLKFRTVRSAASASQAGGEAHARLLEADPSNLTWAGRRIVKPWYLDELPQLVNVLKGDMSLVGPRPLILDEDCEISAEWARRRLDLKPGMTGLWQVLGRSAIPFEEMVRLDYLYVTSWSLGLDCRLLLRTIPVVVRSGATGSQ
jgi:lipopolysaccharide/colanic/teichoic acid biosynthesis glycosyltransferase